LLQNKYDITHLTLGMRLWSTVYMSYQIKQQSTLPLIDLRDAVAQRMLNILYHIIW